MIEKKIEEVALIREQIADIIRGMIIDGQLESDQKISERQISSMLNVSTTPVKEAFRTLQSEGLIYSVPRKGSYVSSNSRNSLLQISYLRSAVEGVAAYFASQSATKDEITRMHELLKKSEKLIDEDMDTLELSSNNDKFHAVLREASHNEFIITIGGNLRSIDNSIRKAINRLDNKGLTVRQKEHEEILEAIMQHDSEQAEKLMVAHVRGGLEKVLI
ncbi:GntR family transcriptional regulator [Faecalicatena contorta]|uniref:GntR family transcriptional regulator n=1 Tax=Faecalicatena contorta TaxID=39482 RepID=UPI00129D32B3|nr:GntR family transcriptional regulator [Faecalicatena contorta]